MTLLKLSGLSANIHSLPILHDIDLCVDAGQIVAITGESGSGKSMTALAILQLLPHGTQCSGQIRLDGRDLRETLGLPEGPIIGSLLERLLSDVIEDPSLNTRTTLLTRAGLVLDELMQGSPSTTGPTRSPIARSPIR